MHAMHSTTLPPALSVLVLLGFAGLMFLVVLSTTLIARKMSGWKAIVERFPMAEAHDAGDSYKKQDGIIGNVGSNPCGFLRIRLTQEGICIYPSFARHNPCLIPWSAIRRVSVSDSRLFLVVDYERRFEFFLPFEALTTVRAKLRPELFHQADSQFDVAKESIKGGTQPRWVSAIVSRVVKYSEKDIEREKESRKGKRDGPV